MKFGEFFQNFFQILKMDNLELSKIDFLKKLLEKNRSNFLVSNKIIFKNLVFKLLM